MVEELETKWIPWYRDSTCTGSTLTSPLVFFLGNFQIATKGIPNNANPQTIGELWVTYKWALWKPNLQGGIVGDTVLGAHWILPFATVSSTNYLGTTVTLAPTSGLAMDGLTVNTTNNVIQFPLNAIGNWVIWYCVDGASTLLTNAMTFTLGSDISANNIYGNSTSNLHRCAAGLTSNRQYVQCAIRFTAQTILANRTVTLGAGTLPGTITSADLLISQDNNNMIL